MSNIYIQEPPSNGKVLLKTTVGDIDVELWAKETPKACRNFVQLCLEGYYDGTSFHRVVKDFIVQGGDPSDTGDGGESIYGAPFKDEFHQRLRFVRRGLVAMANAGPHDNGSQFFFTMAATPELQNKHTIFGKVVGDTLYNMLKLQDIEVNEATEKPVEPHRILSTEVLNNPFEDIVPRQIKRAKRDKDEEKKIRSKSKATKNFSLLSFGDEAEDDEEQVDKATESFRGKSKSSHDLTDDPRLSSIPAIEKDGIEEDKRKKKPEGSTVEDKNKKGDPAPDTETYRAKPETTEDEGKKKADNSSTTTTTSSASAEDSKKKGKMEIKEEERKKKQSDATQEKGEKKKESPPGGGGGGGVGVTTVEEGESSKKRTSEGGGSEEEGGVGGSSSSSRKTGSKAEDAAKDEQSRRNKKPAGEQEASQESRKRRAEDGQQREREEQRKKRRSREREEEEKRKRKGDEDSGRKKRKDGEGGGEEEKKKRKGGEEDKGDSKKKMKAEAPEHSAAPAVGSEERREGVKEEETHSKGKKEKEDSSQQRGKEQEGRSLLMGSSEDGKQQRMEELKKEQRRLQRDLKDFRKRGQDKVRPKVTAEEEEEEEGGGGKGEEEDAEEKDLLVMVKKERMRFKQLKKQQEGGRERREETTLAMLAKFRTKMATARSLADYDDDNDEEKKDDKDDEDDPEDMSWLRHKLHFEAQTNTPKGKVIDANVHDDDRYILHDPRNPLTQRRREGSKRAMRDKR